jgi:ankyrin repeat protein
MSNQFPGATRTLPDHPNLRYLKDQAKDLLKAGTASSLADAQLKIAREYGFPSWPKLKAHVDALEEAGQLKDAIDRNDLPLVQSMMSRNPALHRVPLGYAKDGPLTWVAECRVPRVPPNETRLAVAKWMIEAGSDVHQGGDAPLMRAALSSDRIPMMELLVACGADVNAAWHGNYPILFAACETLSPGTLHWLLEHGADPNCGNEASWKARGIAHPGTALDYLLGTYVRDPEVLSACIEILLRAGGKSKHESSAVLAVVRGRIAELTELLDENPDLLHQRFPGLDFGTTAARMLTLRGGTLLHVAAEFQTSMLPGSCWITVLTSTQQQWWTILGLAGKHLSFTPQHSRMTLGFRLCNCWWSEAPISHFVQGSQDTMRLQVKWWSVHRSNMRCYFRGTRDQRPST